MLWPSVEVKDEPKHGERKVASLGKESEFAVIYHLIKPFHVLQYRSSLIPSRLRSFGARSSPPYCVDRGSRCPTRKVVAVVRSFPRAAIFIACFRTYPDEAGKQAQVTRLPFVFCMNGAAAS